MKFALDSTQNRTLPEGDALRTKDLDVISLANISQGKWYHFSKSTNNSGSKWMYAHVVSTYLFTLCMWGLMYKLYQSVASNMNSSNRE